jgi:FkbM family methyltransferase
MRRQISSLNEWRKLVGVRSTVHWLLIRVGAMLGIGEPKTWRARPRQVEHALTARLRGSSDMNVFSQIFEVEEYSRLRDLRNVYIVLDLGANVGFSTAYFLSCFPKSRVVAVEPDRGNLAVCRMNLAAYGDRALVLHGAAWSERGRLDLSKGSFGDGRDWAIQVAETRDGGAGDVEAWDVGSLIEMAGGTVVDLLKIDIERAEIAVFGDTAKSWLPRIRNICIELHGADCQEAFFSALADFDYELEYSGEVTICRNLRVKTTAR